MDILDRMAELVAWLNARTAEYDKGFPTVSDKEWDDKYFELENLEKENHITLINSPTQKVNYEVVSALEKVAHNHKMLSLDKTKDWNEFVKYFSGRDAVLMGKLDGLTCSLCYENGELVSAETRGNGIIGENILHNARVIPSIPKRISLKEHLVVDGEIISTADNFKPFADTYANQRNFASGSIRLLDAKECEKRHLTFVVWNVVEGIDSNSFITRLEKIQDLGFEVVPWCSSVDDWDAKQFVIDNCKVDGYPIDGLVARFDNVSYGESLGETGHHSKSAYAFKFYDEEYETTLKHIEWTMGRTGVLTPIAVFEEINTGDSTIQRASLHNYTVMRDTLGDCAYVGEPLKIFKANMIIPQVKPVDKEFRYSYGEVISRGGVSANDELETCPICGGEVEIITSDTGIKNYVCKNPHCSGKLINRLDHFCGKSGLDIKGLSTATLEKLIDWEWVSSLEDIYHLADHRAEWIKKPGFGAKSVQNILDAIEKSKNCELHSFITAIGIPLIGSVYAKTLAKEECTWVEFMDEVADKSDFTLLDGFGIEMKQSILNFNYDEAKRVAECLNIKNSLWGAVSANKTLDGKTVVITGKLNIFKNRAELQSAIEKAGGKVGSSVSKNTSYLINNDLESASSKNETAKKLNIPIISEEDFQEKYLKNI